MTPILITIDGQCVDGYFYADFSGIWVVHPASNGKAFSQIRGFAPEVQAAKVLRKLATRAAACQVIACASEAAAETLEWHPASADGHTGTAPTPPVAERANKESTPGPIGTPFENLQDTGLASVPD